MSLSRLSLVAAACLLASTAAQAATISFGVTPPGPPITTSLLTTNFTTTISLPKFNTTLGALTGVSFSLAGVVVSTIRFENTDAAPAVLTGTSQATVTLTRPDTTTLVAVVPAQSRTASEGAYDGVTDFAGTSGNSFTNLTGSNTASSGLLTSAADLALFSQAGGGFILLPITAVGQSSVTGSGNVVSQITTRASGDVVVTYTFNGPVGVPEPASIALLGAGLFGLGLIRRRAA